MTHGWRPTSDTIQPACSAMKPSGDAASRQPRAAGRLSGRRRQRAQPVPQRHEDQREAAATMIWKAMCVMATGGRSSRGKSFSP
jgi:hypothetical protein